MGLWADATNAGSTVPCTDFRFAGGAASARRAIGNLRCLRGSDVMTHPRGVSRAVKVVGASVPPPEDVPSSEVERRRRAHRGPHPRPAVGGGAGVPRELIHPGVAKHLPRGEEIVELADDPDVREVRGPAERERLDVIGLEPAPRAARAAGGEPPLAAAAGALERGRNLST